MHTILTIVLPLPHSLPVTVRQRIEIPLLVVMVHRRLLVVTLINQVVLANVMVVGVVELHTLIPYVLVTKVLIELLILGRLLSLGLVLLTHQCIKAD